MSIDMEAVKELRHRSGAGVLDCKKALQECDGDIEKAVDYLREKGLAKAAKKAGRTASEGLVFSYIHTNGKIGTLVELNCETDFVARTDEFQELGKEIAMHIAAAAPLYVSVDDVPAEDLEREKEIYKAQALEEGKPEHIVEKIAEGRLAKFYEETCLLEQKYIRDPEKKIKDLIIEKIAVLGENIVVRRFSRFSIGE
ncbi:translation elongation factor Ts [Thermovirga lienii DSM 17291]|jgi:elongation factor Ts|uniref:Elongation factor Ts n=1 Tax=Thermovirga lienii (strain ATCC BAA-1197 / DSM 17291 / Cas60314) TaxID=580340 RepID=G7V5D1_THELD|nr:translation elongation factor Ts [Thermovirga lienii]AER66914.1 translation elongation factor Ts [Thermovirga lienii DSM 17291]MDN5318066.1 elongation factor Ts [Thermovirga sp.]MDN5367591.1 elongation factor Ts [Thermovirga sp.]HCD71987.1 translation elongation factor Ts [Thermovirga lienii]